MQRIIWTQALNLDLWSKILVKNFPTDPCTLSNNKPDQNNALRHRPLILHLKYHENKLPHFPLLKIVGQ